MVDWKDELFLEKIADWGMDEEPEEQEEVWYKVSYINDEYDDCDFFSSLEEAEDFMEEMEADGYECKLEERRG